jgi:hypothetical protein
VGTLNPLLSLPLALHADTFARMFQYVRYVNQAQGLRSGFGQLPSWARSLVFLAALPGIVIAVLSFIGLGVSIVALLLLTVPVYRLLRLVCFSRPSEQDVSVQEMYDVESPGRRQIDAKVIE